MSFQLYRFGQYLLCSDFNLPDIVSTKACAHRSRIWIRRASDNDNIDNNDQKLVWSDPLDTFHLSEAKSSYALHFPQIVTFHLSKQENLVLYQTHTGATIDTIRHLLLDQVLPRYLTHLGQTVLHGAAVATGREAIMLLGETGAGKSTLAAYLATADETLLSDDAVVVDGGNGPILIRPTYPALRLWKSSIDELYASWPQTGPVAHYSEKFRVNLTSEEQCMHDPMHLTAIFRLVRGDQKTTIAICSKKMRESCMLLLQSTFQLDPGNRNTLQRVFNSVANIAIQTPIYDLHYPSDFSRLEDVRQSIADQLSNLSKNHHSS